MHAKVGPASLVTAFACFLSTAVTQVLECACLVSSSLCADFGCCNLCRILMCQLLLVMMLSNAMRSLMDICTQTVANVQNPFMVKNTVHAECVRSRVSVWWCMQAVERAGALVGKANPIHHDEIW